MMDLRNNISKEVFLGASRSWKVLLSILLVVTLIGFSQSAMAAPSSNPVQQALNTTCINIFNSNASTTPPGITTPMVACMTAVINSIGTALVTPVVNKMRSTVAALMVLAVMVIGFRIMFGSLQRDSSRELVILLIKMAAVSYFALGLNFRDYLEDMKGATAQITTAAVSVLTLDTDVPRNYSYISPNGYLNEVNTGSIPTTTANLTGVTTPPTALPGGQIWFFVDDMIRHLIGLDSSGSATWGTLGRIGGAFIIVVLLLVLGPIGFWVLIVVFSVCLMMFMSLGLAMYLYIVSLLALLFLTAIGPICIPLILFKSWGMPMFENWLKQVISYTMQPLVLTVFFVFMLTIMHAIIFDLQALYQDAFNSRSDNSRKNEVSLAELSQMQKSRVKTKETKSVGRQILRFVSGEFIAEAAVDKVRGIVQGQITFPMLDWNWDRIKEFIITLSLAFVCMLVMFTFQKSLPEMVTELVGEGDRNIHNLASLKTGFGGDITKMGDFATQGFGKAMQGMQGGMGKMMGGGGGGGGGMGGMTDRLKMK